MADFDFDLLTIGAGSGGVAASRRASEYGTRVAICEAERVGGTCVLRGCVPKKLLVYAAGYSDAIADAPGFGWTIGNASLDWSRLMEAKRTELDRLNRIYLRMLRDAGVTLLEGRGTLIDGHTVEVAGKRHTAERILLATGGRPSLPDIPGVEHAITSDGALELERVPERMVIVGGGYIAVEFAGIFAAAGSSVELVVRGANILRGFDEDVRERLADEMRERGIQVLKETRVVSIERTANVLECCLDDGEIVVADEVLYATGRVPNTEGLGLEATRVELDAHGAIPVDEWSQTREPSIFAVGDLTNLANLTPVAIKQGRGFAETTYNGNPMPMRYDLIPTAVFSNPPVGTVGLSESDARRKHGEVNVYRSSFRPMRATLSGRAERTMVKMIVAREGGRVLGCHMVGHDAPEIIQGLAVAMRAGATKADFDATVGIHPSSAEEFVTLRVRSPDA